jgi:TorA maturation chaperone TorD
MNQDKFYPLAFSTLAPEEQSGIKEALKLLILIFWSQGGKKDWLSIVENSHEAWKSLDELQGLDKLEIIASIEELKDNYTPDDLKKELESEFVRIFINTRGGVNAPLYHSCYHDEHNLLMKEPALEMSGLLEQAGMGLGPDIGEPPDHLCIELEYLFFLLSQPHLHNDQQLSGHTRMFARDFMLPWLEKFHIRIPENEAASFFAHSALAMNRLLSFISSPV